MGEGTGRSSMVQLLALGESWQVKNQSEESPFDIERRIVYRENIQTLLMVLAIALVLVPVIAMVLFDLSIDNPIVGLPIIAVVIAFFVEYSDTPARKHQRQVWEEFKRHHDVLVEELGLTAASTSLSEIISRTKKRLSRQREEIRRWNTIHFAGMEVVVVPSIYEVNEFHTKVVAYWRLHAAYDYLGLNEEVGGIADSDDVRSTYTFQDTASSFPA